MKSDYVELSLFEKIFPYMTEENRRAVSLSLQTGLRIGDVVSLKRKSLNKKTCVLKYKAQKTGKSGEVLLSREMTDRLVKASGKQYLFPGTKTGKHRTRQAVWKNIKEASKKAGIENINITPHSCRKTFAVSLYRDTHSLEAVQMALQHNSRFLAEYYATSDIKKRDSTEALTRTDLIDILTEFYNSIVDDLIERITSVLVR